MDAKLCPHCSGPLRPNLVAGPVIACPHCGKRIANPRHEVGTPPVRSAEVPIVVMGATAPQSVKNPPQFDFQSSSLPLLFVGGIVVGAIAVLVFLVLPLITSIPEPGRPLAVTVPERDLEALARTSSSFEPAPQPGSGSSVSASDLPLLSVADVIEAIEPSVVRIDVLKDTGVGTGSGFFLTGDGVLATNYHVVENARSTLVTLSDGTVLSVDGQRVLSRAKDFALLHADLNGHSVKPVKLAQKSPRKGDQVVAIGAPIGLPFSASEGIVSAVRSSDEARRLGLPILATLIQTTTPVSGGNSGGPLVNMRGEVVGINTLGSVGSEAQNLNFAVSHEEILALLKAIPKNSQGK